VLQVEAEQRTADRFAVTCQQPATNDAQPGWNAGQRQLFGAVETVRSAIVGLERELVAHAAGARHGEPAHSGGVVGEPASVKHTFELDAFTPHPMQRVSAPPERERDGMVTLHGVSALERESTDHRLAGAQHDGSSLIAVSSRRQLVLQLRFMAAMDRDRIIELDKRRVWHPYTAMRQYIDETHPFVIERAEGSRIYDVDGKSYLDANSSWWVALLGHRHPRLLRALREQSERMCHVALAGIAHEPSARLADELCAVAPDGLERVFFSDDGSTSVEVALKLALQFWHNKGKAKTRFVALDGAFHGDTLGATGLGGVEVFRRPFASVVLECVHTPVPSDDGYEQAFDAITKLVRGGSDEIAAVVLEPLLQGAAGMRIYPPAYLRAVRELCDRHDVLLIVDEVFTGYGRTGSMWACDQAGISPDLLCTAKGFTAGILPMAATLASERVFEAFLGEPEKAFYYGHTYCGHPLGAAIAREVLAIYRDEDIVANVAPKAERIAACFEQLAALDGVKSWRALGMVGALDLDGDAGYLAKGGWKVFEHARERGAYLRPLGNVVYVAPPLNISDKDLDELLTIVDESVRAVLAG
jgi:adenosylmethionine-8-amino-7-oxononanoate aminotransferase